MSEAHDQEHRDTDIEVVVLDLAGTTVRDDGLVSAAFEAAFERVPLFSDDEELERGREYVSRTMGHSKIAVFRELAGGDEQLAQQGNVVFERAYAELMAGRAEPIEGAEHVIRALRSRGIKVALTTGFSPATRDALLGELGWSDLADVALSPADVGRGRPAPDLPLGALIRLQGSSVDALAVCGDTPSDMQAGRRSGAAVVAGVRTGGVSDSALVAAGALTILDSVAELPALVLGD